MLGAGFENLKTHCPLLVFLCSMLTVQDVSPQLPALPTMLLCNYHGLQTSEHKQMCSFTSCFVMICYYSNRKVANTDQFQDIGYFFIADIWRYVENFGTLG